MNRTFSASDEAGDPAEIVPPGDCPRAVETASAIEAHEPRNLIALASFQILLRIGWIFKTESVIMPAVMDALAPPGAYGWLRGFLPVLNRFGQSVPPMLAARRLQRVRTKRRALAAFTFCSAAGVFGFSVMWLFVARRGQLWPAILFLCLYGLFHACNGLLVLSSGTLQGKLIRPTRRGRLMATSSSVGAVGAILFAWWLLAGWLELGADGSGFVYIFAFTGVCFLLGGLALAAVAEPPDARTVSAAPPRHFAAEVWGVIRRDANFRRLVGVAMLFGATLILFPHYQALGRERLGLNLDNLMLWVVVQNAGTGVFSLLAGPMADRHGTRLALRVLVFAVSLAPLLAVGLAYGVTQETGRALFWMVFVIIGLTPVTMKTLINYTLEISPATEHPRYLSTLSLCIALPFCLSPAIGWLADAAGFRIVFLAGSGLIALGGVLTFRLSEPRHSGN